MASIGGLSAAASSGVNNTSSIKGYGGLASGLDRDSLIENMTQATRRKIAAQKQKMQTFQWQQTAMQNITSKLYELSSKFMSYASSSNLTSSKLFSRNLVTALGENSKYLSVTGSGASADTISVLGVKSLAKNAQMISNNAVSNQTLKTGSISNNLEDMIPLDKVSGDSMYITYGTKTYTVTLSSTYDYSSADKTAASINKALSDVTIGTGKTLADVMEVTESDNKLTFVNKDTAGNTLALSGSTGDLLADLGFMEEGQKFEDLTADEITITKEGLPAKKTADLQKDTPICNILSGKEISFSYNGTIKWITLGEYDEDSKLETVTADLQSKLNDAFGKGRISVKLRTSGDNSSYLEFTTITPGGTSDENLDLSSSLAITAADKGILGDAANTVFGIPSGESNRLNLSASIANSGLKDVSGTPTGEMVIENDGESVNLKDLGLSWDSSVNDIINAINNSKELGIKVSYQSNTDKFLVQSTEQGASGNINLKGNLASVLFGTNYTVEKGQDAVISVQYAGSNTVSEITRGSNTISMDGLNITLKGTFGYDDDGLVTGTSPVTFDANVDTDNTTSIVKEMIDVYNEVLGLINSEVNQKPDRNYKPLTDEQRAEMSDSQVEKWETEAKKGLLFNDTDLRGLADSLRFIIPSGLRADFEKMGITVSTSYSDNGKLVFDEEKFKTALGTDPDAVMQAFTAGAGKNEDKTTNTGGLMTSMKTIMDRYASMTGATKGILVERAGSVYAPTSVLKNGMQTQIDSIKDYIDQLNKKLAAEQDRYVSQFTALETLISQMNSQSGYLSSMFSS
ncbi:flagellar filament capping protein FliD [Clostridium sp. C105KSO13]|uniref:flagellar filament capping protein FliD n=1 Tax=Clostridium sp. C105KSO13 TaxID=1776045 RepID=UPI00074086F8|nr:flagellar filament capping protein FliD [Clostridium sp. C105KSO13]CUX49550.1 flagellar capping protein [Clostridium sp. C105KSO13]